MDGHTFIEKLKRGLMAAVRKQPTKNEKEIFAEIVEQMFQDQGVRVSVSWVRNMLYQTYDPSVIKAMALHNVLEKMQVYQHSKEQEAKKEERGSRAADQGQKDEEQEPLVYLQMLREGKI